METGCEYYFLTDTAIQIWKSNNIKEQEKMFTCLVSNYQQQYYARVLFKNAKINAGLMELLAEEAFIKTWEDFSNKGKKGTLQIIYKEYPWYLFKVFKHIFLKLLGNEEARKRAEEIFGKEQNEKEENADDNGLFSPRTQRAFDKLTNNCQELLTWWFIDKLSYDLIAERKKINRDNCTKMVWQCKQNFIKFWEGK